MVKWKERNTENDSIKYTGLPFTIIFLITFFIPYATEVALIKENRTEYSSFRWFLLHRTITS